MPSIELRNLCKYICHDVSLKILDKELLVLAGPTGAGKTTLLNAIAGLIDYEGSVMFDGAAMDTLPPHKRGVGYLFQDLALFPHLTVTSNIAYGLRVQRKPSPEVKRRVEELLQLMGIEHLSQRYPRDLSGGERQRVALARTLASSPKVLLLDEPLSSLDFATSKYLRTELRWLQRKLGITTIYVTHNLSEAEEMADRIAVIHQGKLEQMGTPEEVFFYPDNEAVSQFIGSPNILDCDSSQVLAQGLIEVSCGGIRVVVPHEGDKVERIAISPKDVYVSPTKPPGPDLNRFQGVIEQIEQLGSTTRLRIRVAENTLLAELPRETFEPMNLEVGEETFLILKLRQLRAYQQDESDGRHAPHY